MKKPLIWGICGRKGVMLTKEDILRKEVIMQMMSNLKLDYSKIEEKFSIDFKAHFKKELEKLKPYEEAGLLSFNPKGFEMTRTGACLSETWLWSLTRICVGAKNISVKRYEREYF